MNYKELENKFTKFLGFMENKNLTIEQQYKVIETAYTFVTYMKEVFELDYNNFLNSISKYSTIETMEGFQEEWDNTYKCFLDLYHEFVRPIEKSKYTLTIAIPSARLKLAEEVARKILENKSPYIRVLVCHSADIFESTNQFDINIDDERFEIYHNEDNKDLEVGVGVHNFITAAKQCTTDYVWLMSDKDIPKDDAITYILNAINKVKNVSRISTIKDHTVKDFNYDIYTLAEDSIIKKSIVYNLSETIIRRDTLETTIEEVLGYGLKLTNYPHNVLSTRAAKYGTSVFFTFDLYNRDLDRIKNTYLYKIPDNFADKYKKLGKKNITVLDLPYITPERRALTVEGLMKIAFEVLKSKDSQKLYFLKVCYGMCLNLTFSLYEAAKKDRVEDKIDISKNLEEFHGLISKNLNEIVPADIYDDCKIIIDKLNIEYKGRISEFLKNK